MSLKARVKTLEEVPEALRSFYSASGDEFALTVEGMVPKAKLDEFRDNNVATRQQLEKLQQQFDGIDPAAARELIAQAAAARDKKLIDAGKVDELVAERVGAMKGDYENKLKALSGERDGMRSQLEGLVIDNGIREAAAKAGVRPSAVDDVLLRGRALYKLVDGKAVPMEGDKPVFGKDGSPMQISEWVQGLATPAPHLFEASTGGGAKPGAGSAAGVGPGRIARSDGKSILANLEQVATGKVQVV